MKKIIIIISVLVLIVLSFALFTGINYVGDRAINVLVDSINTIPIDEALSKLGQTQEKQTPKGTLSPTQTAAPLNTSPKPEKKEISFDDKTQAINLIKSKFSVAEITQIQSKVAKGLTSSDIKEIKELVKSRLSEQEISKIREWYVKYK